MIALSYYTWTTRDMTPKTINQLNTLNQQFYATVAEPFSDSRSQAWAGWQKLAPYLTDLLKIKSSLRVLDLGCGNGRFGHFLATILPITQISYTGLDSNPQLLNIAQQTLTEPFQSLQLIEVDLVTDLQKPANLWLNQEWDVIVCFGVLHHIPSLQLRQELVTRSTNSLTKDGLFAVAAWQFMNSRRLEGKVIPPDQIKIDPNELEEHDYILSWDRGTTAYRYCHLLTHQEIQNLMPENSNLVQDYFSDGKEGNLNRYLVISG